MKRSDRKILDEAIAKIALIDSDIANYLARALKRKSTTSSEYWYCRGLIDGFEARGILEKQEYCLMFDTLLTLFQRG